MYFFLNNEKVRVSGYSYGHTGKCGCKILPTKALRLEQGVLERTKKQKKKKEIPYLPGESRNVHGIGCKAHAKSHG